MAGGDRKFYSGQRKGKTFEQVSRDVVYVRWAKSQAEPSNQLRDFLTWFERYYLLTDGKSAVEFRASLGIPPEKRLGEEASQSSFGGEVQQSSPLCLQDP